MTEVAAQVQQILEPVVRGAGLFLEAVTVSGPPRKRIVKVVVDLPDGPGGVGSDQLGAVSHAVSGALDENEDILDGAYLLEVTTPGVSRPLTSARHFRRAHGRLVAVTTPDGSVTGRVTDVDHDTIHLQVREGKKTSTHSIPLDVVEQARIEVELRRLDED